MSRKQTSKKILKDPKDNRTKNKTKSIFLKTNKIDRSLIRLIKEDQNYQYEEWKRDMITKYADDIKRIIQNYYELYAKNATNYTKQTNALTDSNYQNSIEK